MGSLRESLIFLQKEVFIMNGFENGNVRYDDLHRIIHNNVSSYEVIKKSDVASAIETTSYSEGDSDYADCGYDDY